MIIRAFIYGVIWLAIMLAILLFFRYVTIGRINPDKDEE